MATIYRFIIEQKQSGGGSGGRKSNKESGANPKTPSKKGKAVSLFSGQKGGVEHNRKFRAINPLLNKVTGGWWEKGTRLGRAGLGLVKVNSETGKYAGLSWVSVAIIASFIIQTLLKWQAREREKADRQNYRDFKNLENGVGAIHGQYEISVNMLNGRRTYNENK